MFGGTTRLAHGFLHKFVVKSLQNRRLHLTSYHLNNGYLSPEYNCQSAWDKRLESNLLSKLDLDDFFHEIEKKYIAEKFISAIDVDMFINKVTQADNLEEIEELTYRLRKSEATHDTLPSTSYAIIRSFITFDKTEELLRLLNDRLNYGVFPDHYTSNLLMDTFLKRENYQDAAKIASLLMMEEDFGPSTTKLFALLSCLKHIESGVPESWEAAPVVVTEVSADPPKKEKKPEEERIRVKYQRNLFYDDHFDLTNPHHIVGKTLAYLSFHLNEDDCLQHSIKLLGWAMFDKWDKVEATLQNLVNEKLTVSSDVVKRVTELADTRLKQIESASDKDKAFPFPKMRAVPGWNLDPKEISECFARLKWGNAMKYLSPAKEILSSSKISTSSLNLVSKTDELLRNAVAANEKSEVEAQLENFKEWETLRIKELDRQLTRYKEEMALYEIERKKKELRETEDTIFFFDNEEKWMMQQPPPIPEVETPVKGKGGKPIEDVNYIPPQVYSGHET